MVLLLVNVRPEDHRLRPQRQYSLTNCQTVILKHVCYYSAKLVEWVTAGLDFDDKETANRSFRAKN
jgi:hypothetical protein